MAAREPRWSKIWAGDFTGQPKFSHTGRCSSWEASWQYDQQVPNNDEHSQLDQNPAKTWWSTIVIYWNSKSRVSKSGDYKYYSIWNSMVILQNLNLLKKSVQLFWKMWPKISLIFKESTNQIFNSTFKSVPLAAKTVHCICKKLLSILVISNQNYISGFVKSIDHLYEERGLLPPEPRQPNQNSWTRKTSVNPAQRRKTIWTRPPHQLTQASNQLTSGLNSLSVISTPSRAL